MCYQAMSAVVADETTVVLAHEVEQAFRGHQRKGEGIEERYMGPRGISLGERKGKVRRRERDVGKGKDWLQDGGNGGR